MLRKTYQSIHYQILDTYIVVNGVKKPVLFRGGSLKPRINGKYTTTDPDEIAVLDADAKRPGAEYRCIQSVGIADQERSESQEPSFKVSPEPVDGTVITEGLASVEEVKTVKDAREYLLSHVVGMTVSKLPNTNAIKNAAAKNNILFPNLP